MRAVHFRLGRVKDTPSQLLGLTVLLLGISIVFLAQCSGPSGGEVVVRSNLPSLAGGHVTVVDPGGKVIGHYELSEKECLCDWARPDWPSTCFFAETTIVTPQGHFELRFYGRDGVEKCATPFINLGLPSQRPFYADCEGNPARAVKRALLCAYLDGSVQAREFTGRVAETPSAPWGHYVSKMARLLRESWDRPEVFANSQFLDEPEDVGIGACGPEKKPVNREIEVKVVLDPEGNPKAVTLVRESGVAVLDEAALYQVREYFFVPALDAGRRSSSRGHRGAWTGGEALVRVPVYWKEACPRWILDPGHQCER